jgi:hypothetical protein
MAEEGIDLDRLDDLRIMLDLPRLGELIAAIAHRLTVIRGIEPPDYDGEEMRELAVAGWQHVALMADRVDFQNSVLADLEQITQEGVTQKSVSEHKTEFGL